MGIPPIRSRRAGLGIPEALALAKADLDQRRGGLLVRRGKGGRRREMGMDAWGREELHPWLELRIELPVGPLLCVINGPRMAGTGPTPPRERTYAGPPLRQGAPARAPHQLRHAHAVEMARENVPLIVIQRQLGPSTALIDSRARSAARRALQHSLSGCFECSWQAKGGAA